MSDQKKVRFDFRCHFCFSSSASWGSSARIMLRMSRIPDGIARGTTIGHVSPPSPKTPGVNLLKRSISTAISGRISEYPHIPDHSKCESAWQSWPFAQQAAGRVCGLVLLRGPLRD
jgi:hypothetical protein